MSYSLLIVDDSAANRAAMKRAIQLARLNADVREAATGKTALDILVAAPVDLVLADISLPGMSAVELAYRMAADVRTRGVPLVAMCAQANAARLSETRNNGVRRYITKPLTPYSVRKLVSDLLETAPAPKKAVA